VLALEAALEVLPIAPRGDGATLVADIVVTIPTLSFRFATLGADSITHVTLLLNAGKVDGSPGRNVLLDAEEAEVGVGRCGMPEAEHAVLLC